MTASKALNAIYRDRDCPPWPIEGELSIYPRESLCRVIISKQGRICGKRIADNCAGSLRQHVKTAHLYEDAELRQRHLRNIELVPGKLGPPRRETVAEVVKELIRRYKNLFDLEKVQFDEDSSSEDEHGESEEDDVEEDGQEEDEDDEVVTQEEEEALSEADTTELAPIDKPTTSEQVGGLEGPESQEQSGSGTSSVDSPKELRCLSEDCHYEDTLASEKSDELEEPNVSEREKGAEAKNKDLQGTSDISSDWGYSRDEDGDGGDEQVFEEDLEIWGEERTWEKSVKQPNELAMMLDTDGGKKGRGLYQKLKGKQKEDTPSKRLRSTSEYSDIDEDEDDHESWFSTPTPAPSKRQRITGTRYMRIKKEETPIALEEGIVKKEESPKTPEVYYLAREGGECLDHEGDIFMSGV